MRGMRVREFQEIVRTRFLNVEIGGKKIRSIMSEMEVKVFSMITPENRSYGVSG